MNSIEITSKVTALANLIAENLQTDQISLLASILVQLSDTLNTIATLRSICENK